MRIFQIKPRKARPFNIDKALEEFAKAGFSNRGPDGILVNAEGQRLSFTLSTGYRTFQDMLTILKEEAAKAAALHTEQNRYDLPPEVKIPEILHFGAKIQIFDF